MKHQQQKPTVQSALHALDELIQKVKPQTSTKVKSAIVAVYTASASQPELMFTNCIGILHLDKDRQIKSNVFRLYEMESLKMLMEVQLYYGFQLKQINQNLYSFQYLDQGTIVFQFMNSVDAEIMNLKIKSLVPSKDKYNELIRQHVEKQIKERQHKGFFNRMKKGIASVFHRHDQQQQEEHQQQTKIINVKKDSSIKFNHLTGTFDVSNIPPQWQSILKNGNITHQDLQDKQFAKMVLQEIFVFQARKEQSQQFNVQIQNRLDQIDKQQQLEEKLNSEPTFVLPPPPPPPPILGTPPPLSDPSAFRKSGRSGLMEQIRNNSVKLRPVKTHESGINLDASSMNKNEQMDLAEHLRLKLKKRKQALNRRVSYMDDC